MRKPPTMILKRKIPFCCQMGEGERKRCMTKRFNIQDSGFKIQDSGYAKLRLES
jgi:hypothetical protein